MKIAFTICSNNYLAQAKILGDSLLEYNPDYKMVIGLCDEKIEGIDYGFFQNIEVVSLREINLQTFEDIISKYDIVELNTSIKPSFFKYFIQEYPELKSVVYLDPDIQIFDTLDILDSYLLHDDILLTPHIFKPIPVDDLLPAENLFLNFGIYNLGFLALNPKSSTVMQFIDWWEERTLKIGYNRVSEGLFVDQLWINLVPLFFDKVKVLPEYGLNVAPWNLHERSIYKGGSKYKMEDETSLYFFHFSNYNYLNPTALSKYYNRYDAVVASPVILKLYKQYHDKLLLNNISFYAALPCSYIKEKEVSEVKVVKKRIKVTDFIPPIVTVLYRKVIKALTSSN
jgi:hypothetical protein